MMNPTESGENQAEVLKKHPELITEKRWTVFLFFVIGVIFLSAHYLFAQMLFMTKDLTLLFVTGGMALLSWYALFRMKQFQKITFLSCEKYMDQLNKSIVETKMVRIRYHPSTGAIRRNPLISIEISGIEKEFYVFATNYWQTSLQSQYKNHYIKENLGKIYFHSGQPFLFTAEDDQLRFWLY